MSTVTFLAQVRYIDRTSKPRMETVDKQTLHSSEPHQIIYQLAFNENHGRTCSEPHERTQGKRTQAIKCRRARKRLESKAVRRAVISHNSIQNDVKA